MPNPLHPHSTSRTPASHPTEPTTSPLGSPISENSLAGVRERFIQTGAGARARLPPLVLAGSWGPLVRVRVSRSAGWRER